jgi:hypothetical protein
MKKNSQTSTPSISTLADDVLAHLRGGGAGGGSTGTGNGRPPIGWGGRSPLPGGGGAGGSRGGSIGWGGH